MTDDANKPEPKGKRGPKRALPKNASPEDFYSILSEAKYMYAPTRQLWEATTVNSLLGAGASHALDIKRGCVLLTWAPGEPTIIKDKLLLPKGGWRADPGKRCFNNYVPADPATGDPEKARPWLILGKKLWGDDLEHMLDWLAMRVQHPEIKINHCLVLGSLAQGIGKDSWLAPVQRAIGRWNWRDVSARRALTEAAGNNAFLESVILQISEAHDLGDKRFQFYDATKDWCAAPPTTLDVADKYVKSHPILNVVGVIYTTNHKTDGIFLPPDDRRHFVAWSDVTPGDLPAGHWPRYWKWIEGEGSEHVAAFLATRDLSLFDPKAPPPKTPAWHAIVAASAEPQDAELLDVLDEMGDMSWLGGQPGRPDAITIQDVREWCKSGGLSEFFSDRKNRRVIPHRFERAGYVMESNPNEKDGRWRINGARQVIYVRHDIPRHARRQAGLDLIKRYEARARGAAKRGSAALSEAESVE